MFVSTYQGGCESPAVNKSRDFLPPRHYSSSLLETLLITSTAITSLISHPECPKINVVSPQHMPCYRHQRKRADIENREIRDR